MRAHKVIASCACLPQVGAPAGRGRRREQFKPSPLVAVFEGAYDELEAGRVSAFARWPCSAPRRLPRSEELTRLESRLPWLATTARLRRSWDCSARCGASSTPSTDWARRERRRCARSRPALRGADHHGRRIVCRDSRRGCLQHVSSAHPRVRRAHGRLQHGADQHVERAQRARLRWEGAALAFTNNRDARNRRSPRSTSLRLWTWCWCCW